MADERRRQAGWSDEDPSELGDSSTGLSDSLSASDTERLAAAAAARDPYFAAALAANLYNNSRLLLASGTVGPPLGAGLDASLLAGGMGYSNALQLQGLQQLSGPFTDPISSSLWINQRLSSHILPAHMQGSTGSGAGIPSNLAMLQGQALNPNRASFLNRGTYDADALMRHELAASNPSDAAMSESLYLDLFSRRQALNAMAAARQYQVSLDQQDVFAGTIMEAQRLSTFTRQNIPYGGGVPPNEAPRRHQYLHQQQDPFASASSEAKSSALYHSTSMMAHDPLATSTGFQFPLDRAEATRFLASGGGMPNELAFAGSRLSRNLTGSSSAHSRPDRKDEPESKASATTLGATFKDDDPFQLDLPWDDLVAVSLLTLPELRGVISDIHFAVMAQMKPCILTHEDRVGLYKTREIGFPGMCCKHCGGVPGFGRYFPGSLTSLVNGNICKSIIKHIREECRVCPSLIRDSILKLERQDDLKPFHYRRGSRRQFFTHVWNKVQEGRTQESVAGFEVHSERRSASGGVSDDIVLPAARSDDSDAHIPWGMILAGSDVVLMSDRHLVPDTIFAATAQTKPCQVTEGDRVGRCKDHKLGSMGLCCKHCGGKAGAFGRYFPSNLHTFAQVEVCKQIVKHITRKCHACPPEIRDAVLELQMIERTKPSKRHPSRMVFFRRVWHRFHYGDNPEVAAATIDSGSDDAKGSAGADTIAAEDIPWQQLVQNSKLVTIDDHGLISDSQFAAIAQMDQCELTEEDRIGYNKNREIGFVGLCCRFCGGRPGFGRYFPNTVRNFEKTSARDTIVSHISLFCQECPQDVRNALLSLKRIESSRDGSATMKGLIYGSGKLFFRRVWARLHSVGDSDEMEDSKPAGIASPRRVARADTLSARSDTAARPHSSADFSDDSTNQDNDSSDDDSDSESSAATDRKRKSTPASSRDDKANRRKMSS